MSEADKHVAALVLAGGLSRRLGRDKRGVELDGRTLLARTVDLVRPLVAEVYVSVREEGGLPDGFGVDGLTPRIPDAVPGIGPMGGILTALETLERPVLALACDMPLLTRAALERLLAARAKRPPRTAMTTYVQPHTGYIEALVAVYEPGAAMLLRKACGKGSYKLSAAIPPRLRHHVPYGPEEADLFFNVNRPADLAVLARLGPGLGRGHCQAGAAEANAPGPKRLQD